MSKPMYLPKGWRAGPDKLGRKFVHDEVGGLYVQVPRGSVLGPELLVNGDFEAGSTGWTVTGADATHIATFAGGTLRYESDTTTPQMSVSQPALIIGRTYQVTVVVSTTTSGVVKSDCFAGVNFNAIGTYVFTGVAVQTEFNLTRATAGVDLTMASVSVREVRA